MLKLAVSDCDMTSFQTFLHIYPCALCAQGGICLKEQFHGSCICLRKIIVLCWWEARSVISVVVSEMVVDLFFAVFSTRNRFRFDLGLASFCRSLADLSEPDFWEPWWSYIWQCGDNCLSEESSDHVSTCFIQVKKEPMWTYWMLFNSGCSIVSLSSVPLRVEY